MQKNTKYLVSVQQRPSYLFSRCADVEYFRFIVKLSRVIGRQLSRWSFSLAQDAFAFAQQKENGHVHLRPRPHQIPNASSHWFFLEPSACDQMDVDTRSEQDACLRSLLRRLNTWLMWHVNTHKGDTLVKGSHLTSSALKGVNDPTRG